MCACTVQSGVSALSPVSAGCHRWHTVCSPSTRELRRLCLQSLFVGLLQSGRSFPVTEHRGLTQWNALPAPCLNEHPLFASLVSGHSRSVSLTSLLRFVCSHCSASPDSSLRNSERLARSGLVASLPPHLTRAARAGFDGAFSPIGPRGPPPSGEPHTHALDAPLLAGGGGIGCLVGIAVPRRGSLCLVLCVLCFCVAVLLCRVRVCSKFLYTNVYMIFSPHGSMVQHQCGGSQPLAKLPGQPSHVPNTDSRSR